MIQDDWDDIVGRWVLRILSVAVGLISFAAFSLGSVVTLLAFFPMADMADARVFILYGPLYAFGGFVGLVAAFVLWLKSNRYPNGPSTEPSAESKRSPYR